MATIEEAIALAQVNANANSLQRNKYNPTAYLNNSFKKPKFETDLDLNFKSKFAFNPDLDTSDGLYSLAVQAGLKDKADEVVANNSGEEYKKNFSGGFVSDIFDAMNLLDSGIVGLMKGKGFTEGVINRESFSDKDSLGKYGLGGIVAGLALDIAVDPLTYIAPWTMLKKIPGVVRVGGGIKEALIGREITAVAGDTGSQYQKLVGGALDGKLRDSVLGKAVYMLGADPVFRELYEKMQYGIAAETTKVINTIIKPLAAIDPKIAENITRVVYDDKLGRSIVQRTPIEDLKRILPKESLEKALVADATMKSLGKRMTELGILGEGKYAENIDTYIRNVYKTIEQSKKKGLYGFKKVGVGEQKARKAGLSEEKIAELDRVEDPAYLLGVSMVNMIHDIHNAQFLSDMKRFASKTEFEGSKLVPQTKRFQRFQGATAEAKLRVEELNKNMKPILAQLRRDMKKDGELMKEINALERKLSKLSKMREEEFFKYFNEGDVLSGVTRAKRKLGTLDEDLVPIANSIKKFSSFDEMMRSKSGIDLELLYENGTLERHGFGGKKGMEDFFDTVRNPYKVVPSSEVERELVGDLPKLVEIQRNIEKLTSKIGTLKDVDKASIGDAINLLKKQLAHLGAQKDDALDFISRNKAGELSGHYIPEEMYDYIDELVNPTTPFGAQLVQQFKYMKVVMSPATHVRNMLSNRILNWWKLGIGPWRADLDAKAVRAYRNGIAGKPDKYFDEWSGLGGGGDTYASQELRRIMDVPTGAVEKLNKNLKWFARAEQKVGDMYQWEEAHAKLSAFIGLRERGVSPLEAFKAAESATFNYAQVTPFIRKVRTAMWGVPFITFPLKATPVAIETILKHPQRVSVFGKIKNALFNAAGVGDEEITKELENEPSWVKNGFYMRLPYKDKEGRPMYFDLSYIIPFGDLITGQFQQQKISGETGAPEPRLLAVAGNNPAFQLISELARNQTFTGNKIWEETADPEKVGYDIFTHILRTFAPPAMGAQLPQGYNKSSGEKVAGSFRRWDDIAETNRRSFAQDVAGYLGFKIQPMEDEINANYQEWNQKKGLQTLLLEEGIIKDFHRNYIP